VRRLVPILLVTLIASRAAADKQACLTAHEEAQKLRTDNKLRAAREKLLVCAANACPPLVKMDCTKWLPEVDRDLPTIIVRAKTDAGDDVADVRVLLDGAEVAKFLDGKPLAIDPGAHTIRLERAGADAREQQIVIAAGDKNRIVEAVFHEDKPPPPPVPEVKASPLPWILAGVGVVGIAGFAAFGLSARSRLSELRDTCAPSCDPSEKRSIQTQLVLADVSLAIGVISLGVATYLFLKPTPSTAVALAPMRGGGLASLTVQF
jgi:hypothetical protein